MTATSTVMACSTSMMGVIEAAGMVGHGEIGVNMDTGSKTFAFVAAAFVALVSMVQPALGDTEEHQSALDSDVTHHHEPNFMAVFVGGTREGSESGAALGIEYERRLSKSFGVGIVAEHTFGNLDFWVYAVPLAYHTGSWKFYIAPGVVDGEHATEALVRFGGEYAFEIGAWEISPQLNADFIKGNEALGLGITIGKAF